MRKTIYFVLTAILLLSFSLTAQERAKDTNKAYQQDGTASGPAIEQINPSEIASLPVHEVDAFVENIRCILGAGRNVARSAAGIHGVVLEGTTGSYEAYWVGSTDDGATWSVSDHLGGAIGDDDRYPSVDFGATGQAYITYSEDFTAGKGTVVLIPDPFLDPTSFTNSGTLTPGGQQSVHSSVAVEKTTGHVAYGWSNRVSLQNQFGLSTDGTTFPTTILMPNTAPDTFAVLYAPVVAIEGSYVFVADLNTDGYFTPTDTAITAHLDDNEFYVFWESSDGGATWTTPAPVFGNAIGDYPTLIGDLDGTTGPVAAAGGDNWNNHTEPIIHNGNVYFVAGLDAVTLDDGTFPAGFWDGIKTPVLSQKQASLGGSWTHTALGTLKSVTGSLTEGEYWYGAPSALPGTSIMAVGATERGPDPDNYIVFVSVDNGTTWDSGTRYAADTELGIVDISATVFSSNSKYLFQDGNDVKMDVFFMGAIGETVVNTTVYHTIFPVVVTSLDDNSSVVPDRVTLNQNFPNPFNPATQIRFELAQASDVSLVVYNALGQEVTTLVSGQVNAGPHSIQFDGAGLSSGVYFYTLKAGDVSQTKKMMLVK